MKAVEAGLRELKKSSSPNLADLGSVLLDQFSPFCLSTVLKDPENAGVPSGIGVIKLLITATCSTTLRPESTI
jgi:hypothetical protein